MKTLSSQAIEWFKAQDQINRIIDAITEYKDGKLWRGIVKRYITNNSTPDDRVIMIRMIRSIVNE